MFFSLIWDMESENSNLPFYITNAREVLAGYGFSKDKKITAEWILENPQKAYKFIQATPIIIPWLDIDKRIKEELLKGQ